MLFFHDVHGNRVERVLFPSSVRGFFWEAVLHPVSFRIRMMPDA